MNTITWVSQERILGGRYGASASLPFSKNDLTSDHQGNLSAGSGFADSYYLPVILGWCWDQGRGSRDVWLPGADRAIQRGREQQCRFGLLDHALSPGQTFYLTGNKHLSLSAFQLYEFHTVQEGPAFIRARRSTWTIRSCIRWPAPGASNCRGGLAGYEQRQTTAKTGPGISVAVSEERYAINALGLAVLGILPRRTSVGFKYFREFANRATFQGNSLQVVGVDRLLGVGIFVVGKGADGTDARTG